MKILKVRSNEWSKEVVCRNCESTLLAEDADLKYGKFYSGMDAEESMDYYIVCPVCGENVFFNEKDIPNYLKAKLSAKHGGSK